MLYECINCDGAGYYYDYGVRSKCHMCDGEGKVEDAELLNLCDPATGRSYFDDMEDYEEQFYLQWGYEPDTFEVEEETRWRDE